jgi:ACS family tartrate transporter-like MFS transporter
MGSAFSGGAAPDHAYLNAVFYRDGQGTGICRMLQDKTQPKNKARLGMETLKPIVPGSAAVDLEKQTLRCVSWRLMPFLTIAFLLCYIDRVNLGFAALQMNAAVGLTPKIYGLGAGILYIGYFFLEVPSNLALEHFGARRWIGRIMISWGAVSVACALIRGPTSFLILRFLLGAAEAGFFPGVILYLTYWYPAQYRARIVGLLSLALPVAGLIGSPISGVILGGTNGLAGLSGWQWIFILEGAPAALLGVFAIFFLTDRPTDAMWLTDSQRQWLKTTMEIEHARARRVPPMSLWRVLSNKYVLIMALAYAGAGGAAIVLTLWMPQLVRSFGFDNGQTGLLSGIPFGIAAVCMFLWARNSDRTGERVWHNVIPLIALAAAIATFYFTPDHFWLTLVLLVITAVGSYASKGPFWALSSEWLGPKVAAAGLAQINALGTLASFFFSYMIGWIQAETHSFALAILPIAVVSALGALGVIVAGRNQPRSATVCGAGATGIVDGDVG